MNEIPEGFGPLSRTSPFTELLGPIYEKADCSGLVIGLFAEKKHCNARGIVHGGVLGTLADIAMGYSAAFSTEPPTPIVTTSQTLDYAGKANQGDWIEVHTDVQKVGRRTAFANGYFHVDSKRIARASAVFSVVAS
ncbi:esterase [Tamilnaduibacter salinus]|uniref:Esterase n=1 Tax=Tamilnaduibacter salinus TaxID=1484056 RepID=A0A2A2I176_9GAMM|nr:PaaI family thioesterase [Tamilnaduibacter salinus]PAV25034.1 esterase [Tamilnaduibacter salinus]